MRLRKKTILHPSTELKVAGKKGRRPASARTNLTLNEKYEAVALAYFADPKKIGWRAYQSVYPDTTQRAAESAFSRLLKRVDFAARIAALREKAAEGAVMSERELLEEASRIARSNMMDFMRVGADGQPVLDYSALTRDQAAALSEVVVEEFKDGRSDQREVRRVKFKKESKLGAIELLMKHYGMMVEKVDHKHDHQHTVLGAILMEIDAETRAARASAKVIEHQASEPAG